MVSRPVANSPREIVLRLLLNASELQLRLDTILMVCVDYRAANLVRQGAKDSVFEYIRMLVENYRCAVTRELNLFGTCHFHTDGIEMSMHCELSVAREAEDVLGSIVHKVGDRRPVAHLLEVVPAAVGAACLVSFSKNRIKRLVPVMSWLKV